ncbi:MAG: DsbC family protein [Arenicella sp.]
MKKIVLLICSYVMLTVAAQAATQEEVTLEVKKMFPRLGEVQLEPSPIEGVYQFWVGANLTFAYYIDGHLMMGDMFDTTNRVSLSEAAQKGRIKTMVSDLPSDDMIVYGPEKPKRVINVFTDIDCGFCRKLHAEMAELNDAGIQIRYLAFPRAGVGSPSYKKYVSAWCADDPQQALTRAKAGAPLPEKTCENPIAKTHALGLEVGLRGTPMLVYDDGTVVSGYKPAADLIAEFGLK